MMSEAVMKTLTTKKAQDQMASQLNLPILLRINSNYPQSYSKQLKSLQQFSSHQLKHEING